MSSRIDIIKEGYSRWLTADTMAANGTSVLIRSNQMNVIFDTCGPWDRQHIIDKLGSYGVHCDDINRLVCSHTHTDHIGNINLFTNCEHIIADHVYHKDVFQLNRLKEGIDLSTDMRVISTPGHTEDSISLVVKNVDKLGTIAITGDLFECESDLKNESIWINAGSQDVHKQRESRQMILNMSEFIIPGHGVGFRSTHFSS